MTSRKFLNAIAETRSKEARAADMEQLERANPVYSSHKKVATKRNYVGSDSSKHVRSLLGQSEGSPCKEAVGTFPTFAYK